MNLRRSLGMKINCCNNYHGHYVESDCPRNNFEDHSRRFYLFPSFPQVPRKLSGRKAK